MNLLQRRSFSSLFAYTKRTPTNGENEEEKIRTVLEQCVDMHEHTKTYSLCQKIQTFGLFVA